MIAYSTSPVCSGDTITHVAKALQYVIEASMTTETTRKYNKRSTSSKTGESFYLFHSCDT
jgi:hypothetical protein